MNFGEVREALVMGAGNLARVDLVPDDLPASLAQQALHLSGAEAVHLYVWDPAGDVLYGAGMAGSGTGSGESVGVPLGDGIGFMFFHGCVNLGRKRMQLRQFAQNAGRILNQGRAVRSRPLSGADEAATAFISALKSRSPLTGQHCARVARYVASLGLALDLPESRVCQAERCGLLHDMGKIGIGDDILEKPGALTPSEWALMRAHPEIGVQILRPCRSLEAILPGVQMHHERFDGKGYPLGVSGYEIPLEARMVNVCDAYDTMTSDRPYRRALEADEAVARLRMGAGTQFDPDLVQVFTTTVVPTLNGGILRTAGAVN